jgi:hypothetical protein
MASSVILLKNMRRNSWQNIMFSDESKLNLKFSDGRVRICRRRRERFADGCVKETDRLGGSGVMVWWLSLRKFMATREIWHLALSC